LTVVLVSGRGDEVPGKHAASALSIATNGAIATASAAAYLRDIRPVRFIVVFNPSSKTCGFSGCRPPTEATRAGEIRDLVTLSAAAI
jgi:hypothetical protein